MNVLTQIDSAVTAFQAAAKAVDTYRRNYAEDHGRQLPKSIARPLERTGDLLVELFTAVASTEQFLPKDIETLTTSFIRVDQLSKYLREHPQVPAQVKALSQREFDKYVKGFLEHLWIAYPVPAARRFQELFSEPHRCIIPKFALDKTMRFEFDARAVTELSTLAPCIVSPHRISDLLVESLGLATFTEKERRSPTLRYIRKSKPDVIAGLKQRFAAAIPVGEHERRFLRLDKTVGEMLQERFPAASLWPKGLHGSLILVSEEKNLQVLGTAAPRTDPCFIPKRFAPRRAAIFNSAFAAFRKTERQSSSYLLETGMLARISAGLERAADRLQREWTRDSSQDAKKEIARSVRDIAKTLISEIESDTNGSKVAAAELARKVKECRDSLGRLNPQASAAQVEKAIRLLNERAKEIRPIEGHNTRDKHIILKTIVDQSEVLDQGILSLLKRPYVQRTGVRDVHLYNTFLRTLTVSLIAIDVRPLSTLAGIVKLNICEIQSPAANQTDIKNASQAISIIRTILHALLATERLQAHLVEPTKLSNLLLNKYSRQLSASVDSMPKAFKEEVRPFANTVADLVSEFASIEQTEEAYRAFATRLKLVLDEGMNFEELAWKLAPAKKK